MIRSTSIISVLALLLLPACQSGGEEESDKQTAPVEVDSFWRNAVVYFIMTDRFNNGNPENDLAAGRRADGTVLRGFEGGDIKGITDKIESGYFQALGVDVIWTTPLIENITASHNDEWGNTYAYHGYWPKDWTAVDPNFGTEKELREMIETAHAHGIRVLADVILNHTGPVTAVDPAWGDEWIRTGPECSRDGYAGVTDCTLTPTLNDIITESEEDVELPAFLVDKWRQEGRLEQEMAELEAFFARTGHPRAPKYYLIKWLTDWVRDYGIDGYRIDTAKHVDPAAWVALRIEAETALSEWRTRNPDRLAGDLPFFMTGEVMNWGMAGFQHAMDNGRAFDYGDVVVDFFDYGFDSLINMGFPDHATWSYPELFATYSDQLRGGNMDGLTTLNYVTSHDDQTPFDRSREKAWEAGTKLLLAPGGALICYGDEVARDLTGEGSKGDAWLRTRMDWKAAETDEAQALLSHFQKLGQFRQRHRAVGAGTHSVIQSSPFVFSRTLTESGAEDRVVVGLGLGRGLKQIPVGGVFAEGTTLADYYSAWEGAVHNGQVTIDSEFDIVLLGQTK